MCFLILHTNIVFNNFFNIYIFAIKKRIKYRILHTAHLSIIYVAINIVLLHLFPIIFEYMITIRKNIRITYYIRYVSSQLFEITLRILCR